MRRPAAEIHDHILDLTGRAILANDVEAFLPWFRLPNEIETFEGRRRISTRAELVQLFHTVRAHYEQIGVTDMVRRCVEASYQDAETIVAMHETRLLAGNIIRRRPYPTLAVLRFNGERWQVVSNSYAIDEEEAHSAALLSAGEVCPPRKAP